MTEGKFTKPDLISKLSSSKVLISAGKGWLCVPELVDATIRARVCGNVSPHFEGASNFCVEIKSSEEPPSDRRERSANSSSPTFCLHRRPWKNRSFLKKLLILSKRWEMEKNWRNFHLLLLLGKFFWRGLHATICGLSFASRPIKGALKVKLCSIVRPFGALPLKFVKVTKCLTGSM